MHALPQDRVSHSGLKQTGLSLYREQRYLELETGVKGGEKEKVRLDLKKPEGRAKGLGYGSVLCGCLPHVRLWVWQRGRADKIPSTSGLPTKTQLWLTPV